MKKILSLLLVAAGFAWLYNKRSQPLPEPPAASVTQDGEAPSDSASQPLVTSQAVQAEARDDADIRMRIDLGANGTYIREMLSQNPMLMRWPARERREEALRVWIQSESSVPNWNGQYPRVAERVFDQWHEAGFPVLFEFQPDSAGAKIHIRWATRLVEGGREIGITHKTYDQNGWIIRAEIEIATFDGLGNALSAETVGGVARHEVGHALGLGHSASRSDVMYPESTTPIISAADRATLHLLYTLPPGVVK